MRLAEASVVAVMLLCGAYGYARAECKPTAVPIGDPVLVRTLSERLLANGIATTASEGCPVVRVQVEQRGQQLVLRVTDSYRRGGERSVRDIGTAAAIIESWTLQEVDLGSLPPEAATPIGTTAPAVAATASWLVVRASGRSAIQSDGSTWLGGAVAGCLRIGWACAGASVAVAANTETTDDSTRGTHRSTEVDTLVIVDVPVRLGRFTLSPGVGLGYGWQSFAQQHMDAHMLPLSIESSSHALRGDAHVALSRPLGPVAIFVELFGDISVLRTDLPAGPTTAPRERAGLSLGVRLDVP